MLHSSYFRRLFREKGLTDLLRAMRQLPSIQIQLRAKGHSKQSSKHWQKIWSWSTSSSSATSPGSPAPPAHFVCALHHFTFPRFRALGKPILASYAWGHFRSSHQDLGSRRELFVRVRLVCSSGQVRSASWRGRIRFWPNGRN